MSEPFVFQTSSELVVLTGERAHTPDQLRKILATCHAGCVFHHTFQIVVEHHYLTEQYANDFAHWLDVAVGEPSLAERVAAVDIRDFHSLEDLRSHLVGLLETYLSDHPNVAVRQARFPFYFSRSLAVVIPTGRVANSLEELADQLRAATQRVIFYHFVEARLRLGFNSNDFSNWLKTQCQQPELAAEVSKLDFYHHTMFQIRDRIVDMVSREVHVG